MAGSEYQQEPLNVMCGYDGQTAKRNVVKKPSKRLLVGTPTLGLVRMEWAMSRFGMTIPCNWEMGTTVNFIPQSSPIGYSTADAQNIVVQQALEQGYEWVLLIEDDTCPPPDALLRVNEYMLKGDIPVVSGLYYQKSHPPEPLIYRGTGTGYFYDFKIGEKVWADGIPTGFFLCNTKVLKIMWDESPEYAAGNARVRRVFEAPSRCWFDEETYGFRAEQGTSDLAWCQRVIQENVLARAGWPKIGKKQYPFLVDTNIFCRHISPDGTMYPSNDLLMKAV